MLLIVCFQGFLFEVATAAINLLFAPILKVADKWDDVKTQVDCDIDTQDSDGNPLHPKGRPNDPSVLRVCFRDLMCGAEQQGHAVERDET